MTPKTTASPSQGAREIAEKIINAWLSHSKVGEAANLIDAELAEVLPFLGHKPGCGEEYFRKRTAPLGVYIEIPCTCGLAALLDRFTPGKQMKGRG